ncbi:helix-turn-helix domain-containing protein [Acinetobacter parvus]|uniref:helix-turn-helix domain-containing protein n=1 Tax=Acinetobacter parvus TaxID=134533 RepID=UPI0021D0207B|nr:helix-turn-helix domain-containing protein [Acinetobacter parvus]MCU4393351.1 helix-turn-helix domain-containing protein [Acinetobacter parvus]
MGALKYAIIVEADVPPQIFLGQNLGGGIVKELKEIASELLSASQLAEKYNISVQTVRRKLGNFNQGTSGKYLYSAKIANEILNSKTKRSTGGARRKN